MISSRDLKEVVDRLTGEQRLEDEDMQQLIDNVRCFIFTSILLNIVRNAVIHVPKQYQFDKIQVSLYIIHL